MSPLAAAPSATDEAHGNVAGTKPTGRVSRLDAFRGIGCLAVLLAHCAVVIPWGAGHQVSAILLSVMIFNGHTALMGFFVISGYVLGLSLDQGAGRPGNFSRFYFRRVFRIYPAHVVTLMFIAVALSSFDHTARPPGASDFYAFLFPAHVSPVDGLLNASLLRIEMNGVTWTLALEVAISIVFPLLYLASRHSSAWLRWGVLVALIGMSGAVGNRIAQAGVPMMLGGDHPVLLTKILNDLRYVPELLNRTVTYGFVFYVGLVAGPVFKRLVARIDGRRATLLLAFGWFLTMLHRSTPQGIPLFLEVCGATILVFGGALMQTRNLWTRALDHPFWNRLGEISYSFYLFHMIVLYCIATVMFRLLDPNLVSAYPLPFFLVLTVLAFLVTAAIATVSYRRIELPMIAFSKRRTPWRTVQTVAGSNPAVPTGVQA